MKPMMASNSTLFVVTQTLCSASEMVKEIAQYKRAIAELEVQRLQMYEQAKIAQQQIEAHLQRSITQMTYLSDGFDKVLKQNKKLIQQHCKREKNTQKMYRDALNLMANAPDLESKNIMMQVLKDLNQQISSNREESTRLHTQLMDANQQFSLSISQRDHNFKDVY